MRTSLYKRLSRTIRGRLRSRVLAEHGMGIVVESLNGRLVVDPGDFNVSRALLERGKYDWEEVIRLVRLTDAASHIVFVGSHIGALLVPIVRESGCLSVVAYKPSPRNYQMLQMNLRLNAIDGVVANNMAVGAEAGKLRFTENRINSGNSRVSRDQGEIEVAVVTLDESLPRAWQKIDLLVMDVEGFEVNAMRGAATTLAKTQRLYVEFAPEQLEEQGSTVEEFVALVHGHFDSVYVMGRQPVFMPKAEFRPYLCEIPRKRGLLLNLLFSRDTVPDPRLVS